MHIVGISAFFHDAAVCLLEDGILKAAAQEERFSRAKHDPSVPKNAFRFCLDHSGISVCDVDCIAYYENPRKKLARQICMRLPGISEEQCLGLWRRAEEPFREIRSQLGYDGPLEFFDHHEAHAASTYHYSGFDEAAILTVDSVGEWATTSYGRGAGGKIQLLDEVHFPDSLGLCYSTITSYLGFGVNDGEYKLMGLAPYGQPAWTRQIDELLLSGPRGQFQLGRKYFDFDNPNRMYSEALIELFGRQPRRPGEELMQFHKDIARSMQCVLERILLEKIEYLHRLTGADSLCMAGGVALNCVANGRIAREGPFARTFVQPAAGDAGGCLGAAALAHLRLTGAPPVRTPMEQACLGPGYSDSDVAALLRSAGIQAETYAGREPELLDRIVDLVIAGNVIGWFQGRMEFGPRALGARSILADARCEGMRDRINSAVKRREDFRPFAPAVLERDASRFFELRGPSPFMLETCPVKTPTVLPAITHVDGSARVQTVDEKTAPRFARLLARFGERTGVPVLLNTSFNIRDEPIVCSPADALLSFARCNIDWLAIENFLISREALSATQQFLPPLPPPARISDRIYTFF